MTLNLWFLLLGVCFMLGLIIGAKFADHQAKRRNNEIPKLHC